MPDHVVRSYRPSNSPKYMLGSAKPGESMQPLQSSWISHWTHPSNDSAAHVLKRFLVHGDRSNDEKNILRQAYESHHVAELRKAIDLDKAPTSSCKDNKKGISEGQNVVAMASSSLQSGTKLFPEDDKIRIADNHQELLKDEKYNLSPSLKAKTISISDKFHDFLNEGSNNLSPSLEGKSKQLDLLPLCKLGGASGASWPLPVRSVQPTHHASSSLVQQPLLTSLEKGIWSSATSKIDRIGKHTHVTELNKEQKFGTGSVSASTKKLTQPSGESSLNKAVSPKKAFDFRVLETTNCPEQKLGPHDIMESTDDNVESASSLSFHGVRDTLGHHGSNMRLVMQESQEKEFSSSRVMAQEERFVTMNVSQLGQKHTHGSHLSFSGADKNSEKQPILGNYESPYLAQSVAILQQECHLPQEDFHNPNLTLEGNRGPHDFSGKAMLQSHINTTGETNSMEFKSNQKFPYRMPSCSMHDVETYRINATVNSIEGLPGELPKFSKMIHHLLITKETNLTLSKQEITSRDSMLPAKVEGSSFQKLFNLAPMLSLYSKQEILVEPPINSSRSQFSDQPLHSLPCKIQDDKRDASSSVKVHNKISYMANDSNVCSERPHVTSKFSIELESDKTNSCFDEEQDFERRVIKAGSHERDIQWSANSDLRKNDVFQTHNVLHGKASVVDKDSTSADMKSLGKSQETGASLSREVETEMHDTLIPNKPQNKITAAKLCSVAGVSLHGRELSTPRTQSLEADHLLSGYHEAETSHSPFQQEGDVSLNLSNRWVKRLRLSTSESLNMNSSEVGKMPPKHESIKLFSKVLNYQRGSSGAISKGKRPRNLIENPDTSSNHLVILGHGGTFAKLLNEKTESIFSDPWIQRWRAPSREIHPVLDPEQVTCEPERVPERKDFQKQFPSVAAMALMGKAISNFRPSEFKKKGSLIIWSA
ncbi:uncharacterized protein LOC18422612 isoform X1 [Amborella trichopoda]|uniref:uncharacterized protein LOC18422612 isoform X1 n=1 Tax=Amborella trichopoda TaxID=13333 RepID=UPI0005D31AAC|nr:uncharacterized protein LOC18422612 isoform X1 [Amborella trichopoda]XP_020523309.1 uncharacterized protein LOC18422612 isoform X1 [Amborella trichopoda]XP_020523313.1 uncharacterized protein LOC18422612 isoform X1 [Amborella trichopoda]XP_020523317.1 uncharacterized protein LOC18422612 isoform X1 [Amborella trichopoda]|eukprot:XP_011623612.1 uncharacterized protein LOC18422612 isoform X1 [Amborella trichopoda]